MEMVESGDYLRHWLMKSEPDEFSIDDLAAAPGKSTPWFGVRNYQARNFMRDEMKVGDLAFFYHSSCPEPGIAGICKVSRAAFSDATQFDPKSPYYDAKATRENPRWLNVEVKLVRRTRLVSLAELRVQRELADMVILRRGNRLSITPVTEREWKVITDRLLR
jgi:predicted RNA-binding protein with PUA-like domain